MEYDPAALKTIKSPTLTSAEKAECKASLSIQVYPTTLASFKTTLCPSPNCIISKGKFILLLAVRVKRRAVCGYVYLSTLA